MANPARSLVVVADDFGIGPGTSAGILDLLLAGSVTATVLLVTSPHAADAVADWRRAGEPGDLGWHPCLTLDRPALPPARVPSLVAADGRFRPLPGFLARLALGRIVAGELRAELTAQRRRFEELVGRPPGVVNAHHHLHALPLVGPALRAVLADILPRPFVRRVAVPLTTLLTVGGGRAKRLGLTAVGRRQPTDGFPSADALAGVPGPATDDPGYFLRWLRAVPGRVVELVCHPGRPDPTLAGRDSLQGQRVREWELLRDPAFPASASAAGFRLVRPSLL